MKHDQRSIRDLQEEIRAAVRELTESGQRLVLRDDGSITKHHNPALLDQLLGERGHSGNRGRSGSGQPGTLLAVDVVDLLRRIRLESGQWCRYLNNNQTPPAELRDRLLGVAAAAGQVTDRELLAQIAPFPHNWLSSARTVLDPPSKLHINDACPECQARSIYREDPSTGETLLQPVLWVDATAGADCIACGAHWDPEYLQHLARLLGCKPAAGVLA